MLVLDLLALCLTEGCCKGVLPSAISLEWHVLSTWVVLGNLTIHGIVLVVFAPLLWLQYFALVVSRLF